MKLLYFGEKNEFTQVLGKFLINDGYEFVITEGKVPIIDITKKYIPDLILVDSSLSIISPYDIIKSIKQDELLKHSPVFLLTEENELNDLNTHIDLGVDEIILKPFDLRYFSNRIKLFYRMFIAKDNNPLTGLPGNLAISRKILNLIQNQASTKFAVIYADLDNFKPYNDIYGFSKGDEIILYTANLLSLALKTLSNTSLDFLGHIGGDDFILITTPEFIEPIATYIISEFDKNIRKFYNEEDQKAGFIISKDREGNTKQFKFLSISLAIVTNNSRIYESIADLSKVAAEVKKVAKAKEGSSWYVDKRNGDKEKEADYLQKHSNQDRRNVTSADKSKGLILIIDDNRTILDMLSNILELEGYEVDSELSAQKALFKVSFKKYSVILTDIAMPDMDGLTLIKEIKKSKYGNSVPIIVISAFGKKEIILEAFKLGVKRFFVKPFDSSDLIKTIDTIVLSSQDLK